MSERRHRDPWDGHGPSPRPAGALFHVTTAGLLVMQFAFWLNGFGVGGGSTSLSAAAAVAAMATCLLALLAVRCLATMGAPARVTVTQRRADRPVPPPRSVDPDRPRGARPRAPGSGSA